MGERDRPEQIWPQLDNSQGGWDFSVPPKASLVCRHFVVRRRRRDIRTALKAGGIHANIYVATIILTQQQLRRASYTHKLVLDTDVD